MVIRIYARKTVHFLRVLWPRWSHRTRGNDPKTPCCSPGKWDRTLTSVLTESTPSSSLCSTSEETTESLVSYQKGGGGELGWRENSARRHRLGGTPHAWAEWKLVCAGALLPREVWVHSAVVWRLLWLWWLRWGARFTLAKVTLLSLYTPPPSLETQLVAISMASPHAKDPEPSAHRGTFP